MEDLGTFAPGGHGGANAINDNGVVVGWSLTAIGPQHAFRWTAEAGMRDLGTIPTSHESVALDVNNRGEIVGYATWADGIGAIPLLWTKDGDLIRLPVLPAGGDFICAPVAINERGNAVGLSDGLFEPAHATLWTAAHEVMDLGTLPGSSGIRAYGINDAGTVVGLSYWPGSQLRAFVWTRGGGMRELPGLPGATRTIAYAINNAGTVVGESGGSAWSRAVEWVRSSSPAAGRTP